MAKLPHWLQTELNAARAGEAHVRCVEAENARLRVADAVYRGATLRLLAVVATFVQASTEGRAVDGLAVQTVLASILADVVALDGAPDA